jgi:hypothetical protein
LALPPPQPEGVDLSGLGVGVRCVRQEQADFHAQAEATIGLPVATRSFPGLVRWIIRWDRISDRDPTCSLRDIRSLWCGRRLARTIGWLRSRSADRNDRSACDVPNHRRLPPSAPQPDVGQCASPARKRRPSGVGLDPRLGSVFRGSTRRPRSPRTWQPRGPGTPDCGPAGS